MSIDPLEGYNLPDGWLRPEATIASEVHAELQRELPPGHLLHGIPVEVVAWIHGSDDILFRHLDKPDRFTVVHLSWLGRTEINAQHPTVEFDGCFANFLEDHARVMAFLKRLSKE